MIIPPVNNDSINPTNPNLPPTPPPPPAPKKRAPRKPKAKPVAEAATSPVQAQETKADDFRPGKIVRRVDPFVPLSSDATARLPAGVVGAGLIEPGDQSSYACAIFWRTVGPKLADLPVELVQRLVVAFEGVAVARSSTVPAVDAFMPLVDGTYRLRELGFDGGPLHKEMAIEFLGGYSLATILGVTEHVVRVTGGRDGMSSRLREVVIGHVMLRHRLARAGEVGLDKQARFESAYARAGELAKYVDNLAQVRRDLAAVVGDQRANSLQNELVNAWLEHERPELLAEWYTKTTSRSAKSKLGQELVRAHIEVAR